MKARKLPSGNWNIRVYDYTDINGKIHTKSFTADTRSKAELAAAKWKETREEEQSITVAQAIERYIDLCDTLSPATTDTYRKIMRYAFPSLMRIKAAKLTDETVQKAINEECKRKVQYTDKSISPRTVRNEWGLISAALKTICQKEFKVRLPKVQPDISELPNPDIILNAIKDTEIELPCLLAIWMGLRMSEIKGITEDSIKDGVLYIDKTVIYADGREIMQNSTKTASSRRKLAIPPYIMSLIDLSIEQNKSLYGAKNDCIHYVVPMSRNAIHHRFTRLMKAQGIDMSFHDLRHLYASISLTMLAIPSKSVQASGGWATPYVMDKVYSQTFSEVQREADKRREDFFLERLDTKLTQEGENP